MIRKFEIINDRFKELQGYLYYNTDTKQFSLEGLPDYTGKTPDITFKVMNEQGYIKYPQHVCDNWVNSRVIPPNRHAINWILECMGMSEYDTFKILLYGNGKCQLDDSYILEIKG